MRPGPPARAEYIVVAALATRSSMDLPSSGKLAAPADAVSALGPADVCAVSWAVAAATCGCGKGERRELDGEPAPSRRRVARSLGGR